MILLRLFWPVLRSSLYLWRESPISSAPTSIYFHVVLYSHWFSDTSSKYESLSLLYYAGYLTTTVCLLSYFYLLLFWPLPRPMAGSKYRIGRSWQIGSDRLLVDKQAKSWWKEDWPDIWLDSQILGPCRLKSRQRGLDSAVAPTYAVHKSFSNMSCHCPC